VYNSLYQRIQNGYFKFAVCKSNSKKAHLSLSSSYRETSDIQNDLMASVMKEVTGKNY
jgi:hypothetical protein